MQLQKVHVVRGGFNWELEGEQLLTSHKPLNTKQMQVLPEYK